MGVFCKKQVLHNYISEQHIICRNNCILGWIFDVHYNQTHHYLPFMMKICLIDDEWICRLIARKLIEKINADPDIMEFTEGQSAIDFLARQRLIGEPLPELILLDINMQLANGWQFLDMLQDLGMHDYHPRIYMSSSSIDSGDLVRAKTYPDVYGYLPKPLTPMMLWEIFIDMDRTCMCPPRQTEYDNHQSIPTYFKAHPAKNAVI